MKYERYEAAVVKALHAVVSQRATDPSAASTCLPMTDDADGAPAMGAAPVIVTVVGAGRGPLVAAALGASCSTGASIF